jgi:hypothetical protein
MTGKNSLRKPISASPTGPSFQPSKTLRQTVQHKLINLPQPTGLLKRPAEKLNNLLHTHSIFRQLDLLNKRTANCLNKRIQFQASEFAPLQRQRFFHA